MTTGIRTRSRQSGTVASSVTFRSGGETIYRQEEVQPVARGLEGNGPFCRVRVGGSITKNMGDFNSVRVEVVAEMPCLSFVEDIDKLYRNISRWVDQKLNRELVIAEGGEVPEEATQGWES